MDIISIVVVVVLAPILVRFLDRAYIATKNTELYKDLSDFDTEVK